MSYARDTVSAAEDIGGKATCNAKGIVERVTALDMRLQRLLNRVSVPAPQGIIGEVKELPRRPHSLLAILDEAHSIFNRIEQIVGDLETEI